jgi:transcriptional regulator with XRE-family HTH domain
MNQNEFALKVGVGRSTVSRWANDQQPSGEYIDPIADVLVLDYDLVATKAGYRPAVYETPPSEREARVMELAKRIDWDLDELSLRLAVLQLEELAQVHSKTRSGEQE